MTSQRLTELEEADLRAEMAECKARAAEIDVILAVERYGESQIVFPLRRISMHLRTRALEARAVASKIREHQERIERGAGQ